jgi:3-methylfumaryl-CoA hydratase
MNDIDIDHLRQWIGREERTDDVVTTFPVRALSATLDRDDPAPRDGDALPPLWHWLYFLPVSPLAEAGPDGHPRRGGFLPPVPLPRRMWAGSRLTFGAPLRVGERIHRVSRIADVTLKQGRAGPLVFVLARHEISGDSGGRIVEEHDIVYRPAPAPNEPAPTPQAAPTQFAWSREIAPDDVLLFRYSALTFNSHRIHYDRRYVTEVEGYPGLVVHGPLIATLLMDLLRRNETRAVATFYFRAMSPLFDTAPFAVQGGPKPGGDVEIWARNAGGHLCMRAEATLA